MRTVLYGAACSLDGFITGPDGAIDWLHFSPDVQAIMREFWKDVDTILMGRKTWEVAAQQPGGGGGGGGRMHTYVFSRTLAPIKKKGVTLVKDDAAEFVRDLKERDGKRICLLGGGELAASLLSAGVVDEVGMNVHPILLGGGAQLFAPVAHRVPLRLTECRQLDGGCVYATYAVA